MRRVERAARVGDAIALSDATHFSSDPEPVDESSHSIRKGPQPSRRAAAAELPVAKETPGEREAELLATVESMRGEIDMLKLSLARERQLRQQVEQEAAKAGVVLGKPEKPVTGRRTSRELA